MVLDHNELNEIVGYIAKKINVRLGDNVTFETICKKIEHQNLAVNYSKKEISVLEPGIKSAFFFKNVAIIFKKPYVNKFFDEDLITDIIPINKTKVMLIDMNNQKIEMEKSDIEFKIVGNIPLDLYMSLMN